MARQGINTGTSPNSGTGDTLIDGGVKINDNFIEVYGLLGDGTNLAPGIVTSIVASGDGVAVDQSTGQVTITGSASTANVRTATLDVVGFSTFNGIATVANGGLDVTGVVTATSFSGTVASSNLSGALPAIDASNVTGITTLIQAGTNVTITTQSGITTINATGGGGGSSVWESLSAGINTVSSVGIGTTNPFAAVGSGVTTRLAVGVVTARTVFGNSVQGADGSFTILNGGTNNAFHVDGGAPASTLDVGNTGDVSVGSAVTMNSGGIQVTGVVTATSFSGDGSGLSGIVASGVGITVLDSDTGRGTSTNLNFGDNLTVSTVSAGFATVAISTTGVITATSFTGDGSNVLAGKWTLGADGTNNYTFTGPGYTGAENDPNIYLVRGRKYQFSNTMGLHPFRIQTEPNGATGTQYNDGITNNDVSNGVLEWDVQFDSPNVLYYQCTSHGNMGGPIFIGNAGDSLEVTTPGIGTVTVGSGIVTAVSFVGDGSTLTGITTLIQAGTNITLTTSAGITTINSTGGGGSSLWESTSAGINTTVAVGIGSTLPTGALELEVTGTATTNGIVVANQNGRDIILLAQDGSNGGGYGEFIRQGSGDTASLNVGANNETSSNRGVMLWSGDSLNDFGRITILTNTFSSSSSVLRLVSAASDSSAKQARFTLNADGSISTCRGVVVAGVTTLSTDGLDTAGIVTATSFEGDGSTLTGITTLIQAGTNITLTTSSGITTINSTGGGGFTTSRATVSGTTGSLGAGATATLDIDGFNSYALLKVGISSAAWVRLYTDDVSRTNDAARTFDTDPTPGSGVIAEVRTTTTGVSTFRMSPGVIGYNDAVSIGSTIFARVTNNETSAGTVQVDLTIINLEP